MNPFPANLVPPSRKLAVGLVGLSALWVLAIWTWPFWFPVSPEPVKALLTLVLNPVCHRDPAFSIQFSGVALMVCTRCTGIYSGFFTGAVAGFFFPAHTKVRLAVAVSFVTLIVDFLLNLTGVKPVSDLIRLMTGIFFGFFTGFWLISALIKEEHDVSRY